MKNIICCGFGHRELTVNISDALYSVLEELTLNYGVTDFYTGGMGDFDKVFIGCVKKLQTAHSEIRIHLIKPYFSNELNVNKEYYNSVYDSVIIPEKAATAHPKSAITVRNKWMTEQSDFVVTCIFKNYGGALAAKKYAEKLNKTVIEISAVSNYDFYQRIIPED